MTNSDKSGIINHEGVVQRNDGNAVTVSILSVSACGGCHAEGSCTMSGKEEKIIEVFGNYDVKPGEKVSVLMKQSMGYIALLLAYILPFIAVLTTLVILMVLKVSELTSGLISVAILVPYYIILYFFRNTLNARFTFTLKV